MKKILAIILALCLSVSAITAFAFDDMPDDWSTTALQHAVSNGLLNGTDNKLLPKEKLTRAQMATILVRALGATEEGDISSFTDVKTTSWYYSAMAISYKMGIFKGDGAGKMNPDNAITRQEAFVVLSRAFNLTGSVSTLNKFDDSGDIATWARDGLAGLVANGYVSGSYGKLNPTSNITRAEFAQVMYNLIKTYGNVAEDIPSNGTIAGNVIVRGDKITSIENISIDGDLIIGDGVASNFKMENVNVSGRVVIRATGSFYFDGIAKELILTTENSDVLISNSSTVSKINIISSTSSFEVLAGVETDKPAVRPVLPTTPTVPDPEEDIWTNFH